jgi:hypothetical protein
MDNFILVIGASGQVITDRNGAISIGNGTLTLPTFAEADIQVPFQKKVPVAAVEQVTTLTITAANSTDYAVSITGRSTLSGNIKTWLFNVTSAASGDTATTLGDDFRTQINAAGDCPVTATGTTTLILTAVAPVYVFSVECTANISEAATTAGVIPVGQGDFYNDYDAYNTWNYYNVTGNVVADATNYLQYVGTVNIRQATSFSTQSFPLNVVILVDESNTTAESALDTALGIAYES